MTLIMAEIPRISITRLAFVCGMALMALWCIASFWFPFGWDQGMFASVGDVIVRGGMPYRDGWEMRGPLAFYIFALAQWLFGRHMWSIRILDLPLHITGVCALASLVTRVSSRFTGYWAGLTLMCWVASLTWFHMVEPDAWVAILISLAVTPFIHRRASLPEWLFSGLMIGCASLIKPVNLGFLAIPLLAVSQQGQSRKDRLIRGSSVLGLASLPLALAAAWFAYRGALADLIDVHILYPVKVYAGTSPGIHASFHGVSAFFLTTPVLLGLPIIITGAYSLWRQSQNSASLIFTWAAVALAGVVIQGKFFEYHWFPLFPPLVVLGAVGFYSVVGSFAAKTSDGAIESLRFLGRVTVLLSAIGLLQLATVSVSGVAQWLELVSGHTGREQYYAAHHRGWFVAADDMEAARYIRERTKPSDGVVVFGNNSLINFLSGRANPTRFLTGGALTLGARGSRRDAYRNEYITGLLKSPPTYLVLGSAFHGTKEQAIQEFPELEALLRERYSLETRIGYLDLFRESPRAVSGISAMGGTATWTGEVNSAAQVK